MSVDVVAGMGVVNLISREVKLVIHLSLSAVENLSTGTNHIRGKSELLAVKHKGILVRIDIHLGVACSICEMFDSVLCFTEGDLLCGHVLINVILVVSNAEHLLVDSVLNIVDVVAQVHD